MKMSPRFLLTLALVFLICCISLGWCKQQKMDFQLEVQKTLLLKTGEQTLNREVRETKRKRKVKKKRKSRKSGVKKKKNTKSTTKKKRKKKSRKNLQRKNKSKQNQSRKNKFKRNKHRKKRTKTRSCEKQDDPCLKNLVDSLSFERDQITNFFAQYNRIKNFAKLLTNKAAKKGDFSNSSSQLLEALGGNGSSPACGGQRMTRGSRNAAVSNYNQLAGCSQAIESSCHIPNTTYSSASLDACTATYEAIQNKNKDCCGKEATAACTCWAEAKALVDSAKNSSCDGLTPSNAVKKLKVACISSFSGCKKAEDASIGYIVTCRTCNSSAGECDLTTPAAPTTTAAAGGAGSTGATSAPATTSSSSTDYCSISTDHTMCKYSGPSTDCKAKTVKRELTAEDKQAIVDKHNELRRTVAKGEETRGNPGPQPAASDMLMMVWDDELATIAQRWADQCTFGHDTKRDTAEGYVGQNAYIGSSSAEMSDSSLAASYTGSSTAWYEEVSDPGFSKDSVNPFVFSSGAGHYTQLVWGSSRKLGCGSVYYNSGSGSFPYNQLIVCNYFSGGNVGGTAMYKAGTACSACPADYPTCSDGLCTK